MKRYWQLFKEGKLTPPKGKHPQPVRVQRANLVKFRSIPCRACGALVNEPCRREGTGLKAAYPHAPRRKDWRARNNGDH